MPIHYGPSCGKPTQILHHNDDDPAPHLEVLIDAGGPWRLAVNVRSDDQTNLCFRVENNFDQPILRNLAELPVGLTRPARDDRRLRLDYIRGGHFDASAMKTADAGAIGDPDTLDALLSAGLQRVIDTEGAELFAFGNPWGPEPDKPDKYLDSYSAAASTTFI